MKKLFLLIPTLLLTVALNAAVININTETTDALRKALNSAASGDIIEMAAGTYVESNSNYIAFTGKEVTVRAAEGAEVILQPKVSIRLKEGARAEFIGIKFDCGHLSDISSYSNLMVSADNTGEKKLILTGCELYGWTQDGAIIRTPADNKLDSIIINNCYFHDCNKSVLFCEDANLIGVEISNSTFANITGSYWAAPIYIPATSGKLVVDHCTFYNVEQADAGSAVVTTTLSDATVSNSIFMFPTSGNICATKLPAGGEVKNTLTYNYDNWQTYGHYNTATVTDCVKADPLFADAGNGDFSFAGDWTATPPSISPARGAATDGSDLGDPRWYTAETLPTTDFVSAYDLLGAKALLNGNIALDDTKIKYSGSGTPGTAKWKLHIEKPCAINAFVDRTADNTSGCQLTLSAYDADGNEAGAVAATSASYNDNDFNLPGCLYIPQAGDYTLILSNSTNNSGSLLEKITLSYAGGAVQNIAASTNTTIDVSEAWFSEKGTRANGKIDFPDGYIQEGWIRWNVHVAESKYYDVTANIVSENGHNYTVRMYNEEQNLSRSEGAQTSAASPLALGQIYIPAGDYTMEVTNSVKNSDAVFVSVVYAPVLSSVISIPDDTNPISLGAATLSDKAHVTDGELYFIPIGADATPVGQWAQWEVNVPATGTFLFSLNVTSENEHAQSYRITIHDGVKTVDVYEKNPGGSGDKSIKHYFYLEAGNYFIKVENTHSYSNGHVKSLVITEAADIITLDENADNSSVISGNKEGAKTIQLIRTIKGGSFNTLCLPFAVNSAMCKDIFGADVEILTLKETSIDNTTLDLVFNNASDIWQGTPVLIMPSRDIVNPVFENVTIQAEAPATSTSRYTNFVGTFNPTSIEASPNNLFLGPNNTLYFPENNAQPIKGLRGWFVLHDAPASIIQRARIVQNSQVVTAIELTQESDNNLKAQKVLRDGQLIIIRNGVRYSIQGQRIQ